MSNFQFWPSQLGGGCWTEVLDRASVAEVSWIAADGSAQHLYELVVLVEVCGCPARRRGGCDNVMSASDAGVLSDEPETLESAELVAVDHENGLAQRAGVERCRGDPAADAGQPLEPGQGPMAAMGARGSRASRPCVQVIATSAAL